MIELEKTYIKHNFKSTAIIINNVFEHKIDFNKHFWIHWPVQKNQKMFKSFCNFLN